MAKLVFLRAINLARYLYCSIFKERLAPWTTNMCFYSLHLVEKFLPQSVTALFWQTTGWREAGYLVRQEAPHIYDVGSNVVVTFFLVVRPWSRSCRGRREVTKGTKENLTIMPSSTTYPSHPSSSPPSSPPHHPPSSLLLLIFLTFSSSKIMKDITRLLFSDVCHPDRT